MNQLLPVFITVYAGCEPVAGGITALIDSGKGIMSVNNLPPRTGNTFYGYDVEIRSCGDAGSAGWLSLLVSLRDCNGSYCAAHDVPALLWSRPWDVPMVCHLPQIAPGEPVYTVTMRVMGSASLAPTEGVAA